MSQKAKNQDVVVLFMLHRTNKVFSAYRRYLKHRDIIHYIELGNPDMLLTTSVEGRYLTQTHSGSRIWQKAKALGNAKDRGICPDLKGCRIARGASKQGKRISEYVKESLTPLGEAFTSGNTICLPIHYFARPVQSYWRLSKKGSDVREPYAVKIARTVPGRGGGRNSSPLFDTW